MHMSQERKQAFLGKHLAEVRYTLARESTLVTVSFQDDPEAEKLTTMTAILCEDFRAYSSGPASFHVPGVPNQQSFGFRRQEDLDRARFSLRLPAALRPGEPTYIGPQPACVLSTE